jgi:hypothetical protein
MLCYSPLTRRWAMARYCRYRVILRRSAGLKKAHKLLRAEEHTKTGLVEGRALTAIESRRDTRGMTALR